MIKITMSGEIAVKEVHHPLHSLQGVALQTGPLSLHHQQNPHYHPHHSHNLHQHHSHRPHHRNHPHSYHYPHPPQIPIIVILILTLTIIAMIFKLPCCHCKVTAVVET